jgi:hypothetical protein
MRKSTKWSLILGAGLCIVALPPAIVRAADPAPAQVQANQPLAFPTGFELASGSPDDGIRSTLGKLTERALTKGSFDSMLGELNKPDRERAREFKGVDQSKLDALIERFRAAWKAKYGKEFEVDGKVVFGSPLLTIQGEVADPGLALMHWPVPACTEQAVAASSKQPADDVKTAAKNAKLEKGRHVALVQFPGMSGMPTLTVSMIHNLPTFWTLDIPDDRGGEQIYNDLYAHIAYLTDHSAQWGNDLNEAYRGVAYHVAAAMYGLPPSMPGTKG